MKRGRAVTAWFWIVLGPMLSGLAWAEDQSHVQLPAYYHPVNLFGDEERPDQLGGFMRTRKQVADLSLQFLEKRLGESEFVQGLAGTALKSFYQTFIPDRFGQIRIGRPISILDRTLNGLLSQEKERVTKWVDKLIPELPFVGNPLKGFVAGQKLSFSGGVPQHSFAMSNPLRLEHRIAGFTFSGGTVLRWQGTDLAKQPPVFGFKHGDDSRSYALEVTGKRARFNFGTKHVATNVEWYPGGLKFAVNLTF